MGAAAKLAGAAVALAAAAALLLSLYAGARHRARLSHCRNNLRHIGSVAARNWSLLDPGRTGRGFWQSVRELEYRTVKGDWKAMKPDPFVCPVHGKTASLPADQGAIDYRGPRTVAEDWRTLAKTEPVGADRPGNHPSGGHVLFLDGSVKESAQVEAVAADDRFWKEAGRILSD